MRIRIDLAYDGAAFHGWATQPGLRTVQGDLEAALSTVLRVPEAPLTCAGRTDSGVHARGQVAHLDLDAGLLSAAAGRSHAPGEVALTRRLNGVLGADVRVRRVSVAAEGFHARFSAVWRRYAYRVADAATLPDPLTRGQVLTRRQPLDLEAMNAAAALLVGAHDFAAFCKRRDGVTTMRTLLDLSWARDEAGVAVATVRASAFCHHMVRSLVGCLLDVGEGRREPAWAGAVLVSAQRDPSIAVVAAHGLTLEEVGYPPDAQAAAQAQPTRRVRTP